MNTSPPLNNFFRRLAGGSGRAFAAGLLLLGPLGAAAQSSIIQTFTTNPPAATELGFVALQLVGGNGQTGYFTQTGLAGGLGAYGAADGNANATPTTTRLTFDTQVFRPGSGSLASPNRLSFDIASFVFGNNDNQATGFADLSRVEVFLSINGSAFTADGSGVPTNPVLRITGPTGDKQEGPLYAFNGARTRTYESNVNNVEVLPPVIGPTTDAISGISTVIINLPSSTTAFTTVQVRIVVAANRRNLLLIDNVSLNSGNGSPLPVSLTRFTAAAQGPGVQLAWATATEKNNDRFEVQRSADGAGFATIGTVRGQGSSVTPHAYTFVDAAPRPGLNYYRLRQVDFDGTASFSPVVSARGAAPAATAALEIYPNPSAGTLRLRGLPATDAPGRYRLLDLRGRVQGQGELAGPSLDVKSLPAGSYLLEVTTAQGVRRQRFTRE